MNTKNLKPFDLQAALNGEPVMLRDGKKAFVRHQETEAFVLGNFNLIGIKEGHPTYLTWTSEGNYDTSRSEYDIIGMWSKTRIINGFEVPAPETVEPARYTPYFMASPISKHFYRFEPWLCEATDKMLLERGLVFLTREDAIANAKAMLGIDPHVEE